MHRHQDSLEVIQQGFALLYCILTPDKYAKFNLYTARSQALGSGIIDIVGQTQKIFKGNKDLMTTIRALQKDIFQDWA